MPARQLYHFHLGVDVVQVNEIFPPTDCAKPMSGYNIAWEASQIRTSGDPS